MSGLDISYEIVRCWLKFGPVIARRLRRHRPPNKAARGELRRGLPVGFVWGEEDGEVRFHPDAAVTSAPATTRRD